MGQTKLFSLVEQVLNVGSGFIVALLVWTYVVIPVFNFEGLQLHDNLIITAIFTVVSIIRGYVWRRIFNKLYLKYQL